MDHRALTQYMSDAMEKIVGDILKKTLRNPKETAFLLGYRETMRAFAEKRRQWEDKGVHIPAFVISSITESCNLYCKGCYARANGICREEKDQNTMTAEEWDIVFEQCADLGIGFHLLAGGEPLLRPEVLEKAAKHQGILFPVFTNGTLLEEDALTFFDKNRNMVPILSMEGNAAATDLRRGEGTAAALEAAVKKLKKKKILFGVSLTVTSENLVALTSESFIRSLWEKDCRVVLFIEYVPIEQGSEALTLTAADRERLAAYQASLRNDFTGMLFLSFPGDEVHMGGCLGAGRGFFHINPQGGVEACPFSPFGDKNLKTETLREALSSPFFQKLREAALVGGEHDGGCALFEHKEQVEKIWQKH